MASLFTNTTLSDEGIRSTIRLRGGLTAKHRVTAWKYIFRLPGNSTSFYDFLAIGPHPAAVSSLATRYPLRDRKLFRKMAVLISALAHWSPIWADAEFAMAWVFPFVVVFGQVRAVILFEGLYDFVMTRAVAVGLSYICVIHSVTHQDRASSRRGGVQSAEDTLTQPADKQQCLLAMYRVSHDTLSTQAHK